MITRNHLTFFKAFFLAVFIVLAAGAAFTSCTDSHATDGKVCIPMPADSSAFGKKNHFIEKGTIEEFKKNFTVVKDSLTLCNRNLFIPTSEAFNKPGVVKILEDPKCVGLKIYYGVKKGANRNEIRLILVGVDAQGNDLYYSDAGVAQKAAAQTGGNGTGNYGGSEWGQCTPPCGDDD